MFLEEFHEQVRTLEYTYPACSQKPTTVMSSQYHSLCSTVSTHCPQQSRANTCLRTNNKDLQLDTSKVPYCIDFPVVLYECETWSLTLREEHRLRVSEKWRFMFIPLAKHHSPNETEDHISWACNTYGGEMLTVIWWGTVTKTGHLQYLRVYGKIILKWALNKEKGWTWIGIAWLRTETCKALLWTRLWTCGFHKILEISSAAEQQWPYQKTLLHGYKNVTTRVQNVHVQSVGHNHSKPSLSAVTLCPSSMPCPSDS